MKEKETKDVVEPKKENMKQKIGLSMLKNKKVIIYVVLLAVVVYLVYTIYLLIKQPTDIFTLEEGKLYLEETDVG